MQITFWGIRGSIPAPGPDTSRYGGNTSCVEVRLDNDTLIVFDAGTGIRSLGNAIMAQEPPLKVYLFLSHMHWDHIQGLPFFTPAYRRGVEICIFGPHGGPASLEQSICDQMRTPYYPVSMRAMAANFRFTELTEGSVVDLPGAKVEVGVLNHPGKTLGYRLLADDKVLVYATDNEPFGRLPASQHLSRPSRILSLAHGADLLIQDAQYTPDEYARRIGWGHSTYLDALQIAHDAEVERLVLFHHDPIHSDAQVDRMLIRCRAWIKRRGLALDCLSAAEGLQLTP